jgi:hypothetical protein
VYYSILGIIGQPARPNSTTAQLVHGAEHILPAPCSCNCRWVGSLIAQAATFSNPGHAHNLAKKLNRLFKTKDFAVYKLTTGEEIK